MQRPKPSTVTTLTTEASRSIRYEKASSAASAPPIEAIAPRIGSPAARNPPKTNTITSRLIGRAMSSPVTRSCSTWRGDRLEEDRAAADHRRGGRHRSRDLGAELGEPRLGRVEQRVLRRFVEVWLQRDGHQESVAVGRGERRRLRRDLGINRRPWRQHGTRDRLHADERGEVGGGREHGLGDRRIGRCDTVHEQRDGRPARRGGLQDRPAVGRFARHGRLTGGQPGEQALADDAQRGRKPGHRGHCPQQHDDAGVMRDEPAEAGEHPAIVTSRSPSRAAGRSPSSNCERRRP